MGDRTTRVLFPFLLFDDFCINVLVERGTYSECKKKQPASRYIHNTNYFHLNSTLRLELMNERRDSKWNKWLQLQAPEQSFCALLNTESFSLSFLEIAAIESILHKYSSQSLRSTSHRLYTVFSFLPPLHTLLINNIKQPSPSSPP
jgi:hypothetical protein